MSDGLLGRMFVSSPPKVALSISGSVVSAVQVRWKNGAPLLTGYGHSYLAEDTVAPMVSCGNVVDVRSLSDTIRRVVGRLSVKPTRIALVLPDIAAKVSLVRLTNVPSRETDLEELLRWKVGQSIPYPVADAQIAYSRGTVGVDGTQEFVASAVRRDVVEEYEGACIGAGLNPGYVDLTTFNLINTVMSASRSGTDSVREIREADWMLVNNALDYVSVAIVRKGQLLFFRTVTSHSAATLPDVVHQACMYYNDRLAGDGLQRAYLLNSTVKREGEEFIASNELAGLESASVDVQLLAARLKSYFCGSMEVATDLFEQLLAPLGVLIAVKHLTHA